MALGDTGDAFELDGYLQGLVPLEVFQQDVLAEAVNEALEDGYRSHRVPLATPPPMEARGDRLGWLIDELVDEPPSSSGRMESEGPRE